MGHFEKKGICIISIISNLDTEKNMENENITEFKLEL